MRKEGGVRVGGGDSVWVTFWEGRGRKTARERGAGIKCLASQRALESRVCSKRATEELIEVEGQSPRGHSNRVGLGKTLREGGCI